MPNIFEITNEIKVMTTFLKILLPQVFALISICSEYFAMYHKKKMMVYW